MDIRGRIRDGVVVLDEGTVLPEGALVRVSYQAGPVIHVSKNQKRVVFPLVRSSTPGTVHLTNEQIGEILDAEDAETVKRSRNVPS
jgi:hypothetical protein